MTCVCFALALWLDSAHAGDETAYDEPQVTAIDRDHWSFRPLSRLRIPPLDDSSWARNPIDHFILARLALENLTPAEQADRTTLVRRLFFDILGIPPTPAQVDQFLHDRSADAYEQLVDRVLASPRYGERWGQHWLDLARFAETDGFEHDKVRPTAWRYRDWVIRALNADMSYDQFVRWQVAGDLLAPHDADATIATAFCVSGPDMPDINSQDERKHTLLNEMTSTVGAVFLGLQLGCAQCHDHMYDPVSQADFYRMRSFFEPAVIVQRNKSVTTLTSSTSPRGRSHLMIRGDWRRPGPVVQPAYVRIANPAAAAVQTPEAAPYRVQLADWLVGTDQPLTARVIVNRIWQYHFGRGLSSTPSDFGVMSDPPSHPELLDWLATELIRCGWRLKDLHRLIVTSAAFRQRSFPSPSRPMSDRWTSIRQADPDGVLLSSFPRRRLEAEVVRDAMYSVSGSLMLTMGGPGVRPPLPQELLRTLLNKQWETSEEIADHYRRSVYVFARRNLRYPLFAAFDRPAANSSCAARQQSTTAPQSLLMLNSAISLDAARLLAGTILTAVGHDHGRQVTEAYRRVLGRIPAQEEQQEAIAFLTSQASLLEREQRSDRELAVPVGVASTKLHDAAALTDFCLALLNSSEFLYVD